MRLLLAFLGTLTLAGCANNQLNVTYYSDPPGATITAGNRNFGRAPLTLTYEIKPEQRKSGKMSLEGIGATWVSGAQVSYPQINVDLRNSTSQVMTLKRPSNVPGLDKDMNYALELEKLALMKRQAEASEMAAIAASNNSSINSVWIESGGVMQRCSKVGSFVSCM